jgi:hypothetical protein
LGLRFNLIAGIYNLELSKKWFMKEVYWKKLNKNHLFKQRPRYQRMIYLINAHQLALHALHLDLIAKYWIKRPSILVCSIQCSITNRYRKELCLNSQNLFDDKGLLYGFKLRAGNTYSISYGI